jgi:hypothetical protein
MRQREGFLDYQALILAGISVMLAWAFHAEGGSVAVRVDTDAAQAAVSFLSWDTEGGNRASMNLLRAPLTVQFGRDSSGQPAASTGREAFGENGVRYRIRAPHGSEMTWEVRAEGGAVRMSFRGPCPEEARLVFPFDARMAATTVLASEWSDDGSLRLPAIVSAPDFGQMLLKCAKQPSLTGRLEGSRAKHTVDFIVELPVLREGKTCSLDFEPVWLPMPEGFRDETRWRQARRGWFNVFEPSARWGDPGHPFSAPPGILSNNVISDPVSCLISLYADQAFFTPEAAPGVSLAAHVRRTIDYWLLDKTRPTGEVVAYWDYGDMLDANASPVIASWDYVESTGDETWLKQRIGRLEFIADYLAKRDTDNDGLVECTHSGNYGTLMIPARSASAYDTINAGYKDACSNELTYRAWRCLADLESKLHRAEQQRRYTQLADRLKAVFFETFHNPGTGWLAWWKSKDGEVHDLACPMINSLAVEYGLVDPDQGREILRRLWKKMEDVGFKRFDLGVPLTLVPVRKGDYLQPKSGEPASSVCGAPEREDGTDTFTKYLNGGCCVSDAVHFITALYIAGETEKGDRILNAMLERQVRGAFPNGGGFQNGVVDKYPLGAEFFDWEGNTCGYEGHLTYSFSFLQAVLLHEPAFRSRLFRPLFTESAV